MYKYTIVDGDNFVVAAFIILGILVAFAAAAAWRGWGIDVHEHLETPTRD